MTKSQDIGNTRERERERERNRGVPYAAPVRRFQVKASADADQRDSGYRRPDVPAELAAAPASSPRADTTAPYDAF